MNLKRNFALIVALGALLMLGSNCTLIYSGCESDSECNMEAGERCIESSGSGGECGLPQAYCEAGATMRCEDAAFLQSELMAAEEEGRDPVALGECANKLQVCDDNGMFQVCKVPEVCDGLDNDCDGMLDNGIEGVNQPCSEGEGACRATGSIQCNADGTQSCSAVPAEREAPACDCSDNNCDQTVNDFMLSTAAAPSEPIVPQTDWEFTLLGGQRFAAVDTGSGVDVIALDGDGLTLATIAGASSPRIFASHTASSLVVFYTAPVENELMTLQEEVHRVVIDAVTGTVGTPLCLGCGDARRGEKGGVISFDVAFAGVDSNLDGLNDATDEACTANACGYVATYVRSTGTLAQVYSARVDALTLELTPNSEGIVLSFQESNNNIDEVQIEIANPAGLAFVALRRTVDSVTSITLASVLASNRVQVNASSVIIDSFDPGTQEFDFSVLPDSTVLLVVSNPQSVELQRYELQESTMVFAPLLDAPTVITPNTVGTAIRNPEVSWICGSAPADAPGAESALVAFEVIDEAGNRVIEAATVDRRQGLVSLHPPSTIAGTVPVIERLEDQIVVGALIASGGGTEVTAATSVTPSVDPLTCDP